MDNSLLLIIMGSSVLFLALVVYKIYWLFNKLAKVEENNPDKDN
ncbi:MAG: hypothetical protein QNJ56_08660 [Gammaproteobacteria bacterium]|nr:hypothetical protein [Gammaproteobacteria bacterium]